MVQCQVSQCRCCYLDQHPLRHWESLLLSYCSSVCKETAFASQGLRLKGFLSGFLFYLDGNRDSREHLSTTVISIYGLDLHVFCS